MKDPKETSNSLLENGPSAAYLFIAATIVIILVLSLASYNPQDLNLLSGGCPAVRPYQNLISEVGAVISRNIYFTVGLAAWPLLILVVLWAVRPLFPPRPRRSVPRYIAAFLLVVFGITTLFALYPEQFVYNMGPFGGTASLGIGDVASPEKALSGGTLGQIIAAPPVIDEGISAGFLRGLIGEIGTLVVGLVTLLFGLFLLFVMDWKALIYNWLNARPDQPEYEPQTVHTNSMQVQVIPPPTRRPPLKIEPEPEPESIDEPLRPEEGVTTDDAPTGDSVFSRVKVMFGGRPRGMPEPTSPSVMPTDPQRVEPMFEPPPSPPKTPVSAEPRLSAEECYAQEVAAAAAKGKAGPAPKVSTSELAPYTLPPVSMLTKVSETQQEIRAELEAVREQLEATLQQFKINAWVKDVVVGPRVVRFELTVDAGIKVSKIEELSDNLKMNLAVESIRIIAPIPGKNAVGVEVPNPKPASVYMRQIMDSESWRNAKGEIPIVLGKDVAGAPLVADLARMPHLLIAGATGAGKSVCMNTLIMSLLFRFSPDDLRLILVDPKVVEMAMYENLPHLITPVLNDAAKVPLALRWGVAEMERRYRIMAKAKSKNLAGYNQRAPSAEPILDDVGQPIPDKMPYLVIIVDELADMMMTDARKDVETAIARIAQKGRAAGLHLVIATQRPSREIVTGVIKANLPTRIAFRVGSQTDSRVILDQMGAERLLGRGDMLYVAPGGINIERVQGAMVEDLNIEEVVSFIAKQRDQRFLDDVMKEPVDEDKESNAKGSYQPGRPPGKRVDDDDGLPDIDEDPICEKYLHVSDSKDIREAFLILYNERKISTSYLQRRLGIGYNSAAKIIDEFEKRGFIGPSREGGSKRDILLFDELNES